MTLDSERWIVRKNIEALDGRGVPLSNVDFEKE